MRRNAVRIKGLPESRDLRELRDIVQTLFQQLMEQEEDTQTPPLRIEKLFSLAGVRDGGEMAAGAVIWKTWLCGNVLYKGLGP